MSLSISKIIGPPGTGKTTAILRLIERAAGRYDPGRIGAVSYTNAAVNEMRARVAKKAKISSAMARNVRTIHSHCFRLLDLDRDHVADEKLEQWNEENPHLRLPTTFEVDESDSYYARPDRIGTNAREHLRLFDSMQVFRNLMIPKEDWKKLHGGDAVSFFHDEWERWMWMNNYIDYTGMLELALQRQLIPDIDVLFVDEGQDLTPLQFSLMKVWIQKVEQAVFAGD